MLRKKHSERPRATIPGRFPLRHRRTVLIRTLAFATAVLVTCASGYAQSPRQRNFDARTQHNVGVRNEPGPLQHAAEQALRNQAPGLAVSYDRIHGVASRVRTHSGFLTGAHPGAEHRAVALDFVNQHRVLLGLSGYDLANYDTTDEIRSSASGTTHLYLRQRFAGLPVYDGQLQVNVDRDGRVKSVNNAWVGELASSVNAHQPRIEAAEAVLAAAEHLQLSVGPPKEISSEPNGQQTTVLSLPELSLEEIIARLFWLPIRAGDTRLVWSFQIHAINREHVFDFTVDAVSGEVWTRFDQVDAATYRVYERPVESPIHTTPPPPADARTLAVNPEDSTFSPLGWFNPGTGEVNIMLGNNVHAYDDRDANNLPPASQPVCLGSPKVCDFPLDLTLDPAFYVPAAVTNLFYWNNTIHDVQALYGFDESAGNFQETNFSPWGAGSDSVNAEAQDGGGNCNANFFTPVDGSNPRMQMYTCNLATPKRDGDLDDLVIVHEYGHGITNRQVGGPTMVGCLSNLQEPGEGWSDWFGLVYTAETGDLGTDQRGAGSYLFNLAPDGTIRPQPYSTDPAINNYTYQSIASLPPVHSTGSVWAQGLWELYWNLVDIYGFDEDLTNFDPGNLAAAAGNQRALLYVNEGLKNTACSPTFADARDGIIQAVIDFDSNDLCPVWQSFADFGLGVDADDCGSNCLTVTDGFRVPVACNPDFAGPDYEICVGESVTLGQPAVPDTTYLWSPGGQTTAQITVSPTVTTTYTVTATDPFGVFVDSATVTVEPDCRCGLSEEFEGDVSSWTATGLWHAADSSTCASPALGYSSATHAFYYGQDASCDYNTGVPNSGTLTSPIVVGIRSTSTLTFQYLREVESYPSFPFDVASVDVVTDSGSTTVWSLDSQDPSTAVWTSSGAISLSAFAGQKIRIRFRFDTVDAGFNDFIGWFVDDVVVTSITSTNVNFQSGASGWTNNAALSTCTTGAFIAGVPAEMVSFGTITQPDGDCTTSTGNAFYTAANTSASVDDVDLGMCVADSPSYSVGEKSLVSICSFHGQRTAGDDPTGDFFKLEISTNGGASYSVLREFGDDTMDAEWSSRGITVNGSANVKFRVRVSDAAGPGDTIEGGVDDVRICPFDGTLPPTPNPCVSLGSDDAAAKRTPCPVEQEPQQLP